MPDIFIDQGKAQKTQAKSEEKNEASEIPDGHVKTSALPENKSELLSSLDLKPHGKKAHFHVMSSYCEDPAGVKFTNSVEDEILLLFLRRHFVTNTPWILKAIALSLVPVIFEVLGSFGYISSDFVDSSGKFIVYSFYYFFILSGYVFVNYMTWFYNISLVSNKRIIDIDFSDIVFENVAATKLSQVQDVNYAQIGIIRSIFDYGDVLVQTAGTALNFEFLAVPHPEKIIKVIHNLIGEGRHV